MRPSFFVSEDQIRDAARDALYEFSEVEDLPRLCDGVVRRMTASLARQHGSTDADVPMASVGDDVLSDKELRWLDGRADDSTYEDSPVVVSARIAKAVVREIRAGRRAGAESLELSSGQRETPGLTPTDARKHALSEAGLSERDAAYNQRVVDQLIRQRDEWHACAMALGRERDGLRALISVPRTDEFFEAVRVESAHQVDRWGVEHDAGKRSEDWVTLITYLMGKIARAHFDDDGAKLQHHVITVASVALNWWRRLVGVDMAMRPGVGPRAHRWMCPACGASHARGHHPIASGSHRCLGCGYEGAGGVIWDPLKDPQPAFVPGTVSR